MPEAGEGRVREIADQLPRALERVTGLIEEARRLGILDEVGELIAPRLQALQRQFEGVFNGD